MRFDLEIPQLNTVDVAFIKEGEKIPESAVPLYYVEADYKDSFPSDYISIETKYVISPFITGGYEIFKGPCVSARSNKFLLTNVAKFSEKIGSKIPLFYRYKIDDSIVPEAVRIIDYFGIEINKDEYLVEKLDIYSYVYMNKINKLLFIEYTTENKVYRKLLNLQPVFREATWADLDERANVIKNTYLVSDNIIVTSHTEDLYISYLNESDIVRTTLGNIEDPWYISVLNVEFKQKISGMEYKYTVPEYYLQQFNMDVKFKKIENKKCKKIFGNIIKSQYNIHYDRYSHIYVYVYDFYTKELKHAFSTDTSIRGTLYTETISYKLISDYNDEGYIQLPISLDEDDIAYVTHTTNEEYYEYQYLNLNSSINSGNYYFALYLKPNINENNRSVFHAKIGKKDDNLGYESFDTYEEYQTFLTNNKYYHITSVTLRNIKTDKFDNVLDIRKYGISIIDKQKLCRITADMFYYDIINENLTIPTNDTVVAYLDLDRMVSQGKLTYSNITKKFDADSLSYIQKMYDIIEKNLNISTHMIFAANIT